MAAPSVEHAFALLRIVAGFLFMFHGAQKLLGAFDGNVQAFGTLRWFAGVIELFGGVLIMIGLFGAIVAFVASGEMAFAYFISHQPRGGWPIENRGELAALFCFIFLLIAAKGSGWWSVDGLRRRGRAATKGTFP
jgi:putative oxidoreductase